MEYELLEECLASDHSIRAFFAGYRLLFSVSDVWNAVQKLYREYKDVEIIKEYIWKCLSFWFENYCFRDLKHHRKIASEIFHFTSQEFGDKELTKNLKTLFIHKISGEELHPLTVPIRIDRFGTRFEYNQSFSANDFARAVDCICIDIFRQIPLDSSISFTASAAFFDHIVYHISSHIIWPQTSKHRHKELRFFINVASRLKRERNYEMMFAVFQGISQPSVKKLHRTWKKLSGTQKKIIKDFEILFDPLGHYSNYHEEIETMETYIPIVSLISREINTVIKENKGPEVVKIAGKILHRIAMIQNRRFVKVDSKIKNRIMISSLSPNKLEELSLIRETSGSPDSSESDSPRSDSPRSDSELQLRISPRSPLSFRLNSECTISPRLPPRARIQRTIGMRKLRNSYSSVDIWSQRQVYEWLKEIGMDKYGTSFMEEDIDGIRLLGLGSKDLILLGIDQKSHQEKILQEILKLQTS